MNYPPFSGLATECVKCGAMEVLSEYVRPNKRTIDGSVGECMERICAECQYRWAEQCLDAEVTEDA